MKTAPTRGTLTRTKVEAEIDVLAARCEAIGKRIERLPETEVRQQLIERQYLLADTFTTAKRVMNENWVDHKQAELANMELRGDVSDLERDVAATEQSSCK